MLSQDLVLALLQASITGAGLVLAIYTLIIPLSRGFFEKRGQTLLTDLGELRKWVKECEIDVKNADKLKELIDKIADTQTLPTYLHFGMGLSFLGYIVSALMSVGWTVEWNKPLMDGWLAIVFVATTLIFLGVGLLSIKDINGVLQKEFERIKNELKASKQTEA